jgi:hypothetical protein
VLEVGILHRVSMIPGLLPSLQILTIHLVEEHYPHDIQDSDDRHDVDRVEPVFVRFEVSFLVVVGDEILDVEIQVVFFDRGVGVEVGAGLDLIA